MGVIQEQFGIWLVSFPLNKTEALKAIFMNWIICSSGWSLWRYQQQSNSWLRPAVKSERKNERKKEEIFHVCYIQHDNEQIASHTPVKSQRSVKVDSTSEVRSLWSSDYCWQSHGRGGCWFGYAFERFCYKCWSKVWIKTLCENYSLQLIFVQCYVLDIIFDFWALCYTGRAPLFLYCNILYIYIYIFFFCGI
jgi:hypothetical protein